MVGPLADKLARCFPAGVISVKKDESGASDFFHLLFSRSAILVTGQRHAVVSNAREDMCSREVLRHEVR